MVASDPSLYSAVVWLDWQDHAGSNGLEIRPLRTNLIDEVWTERPERSKAPLHVHELEFAGGYKISKSWYYYLRYIFSNRKSLQVKHGKIKSTVYERR